MLPLFFLRQTHRFPEVAAISGFVVFLIIVIFKMLQYQESKLPEQLSVILQAFFFFFVCVCKACLLDDQGFIRASQHLKDSVQSDTYAGAPLVHAW